MELMDQKDEDCYVGIKKTESEKKADYMEILCSNHGSKSDF